MNRKSIIVYPKWNFMHFQLLLLWFCMHHWFCCLSSVDLFLSSEHLLVNFSFSIKVQS
jgi:hypothetical protein